MHVTKLRLAADEPGPVPAGVYFQRLAHSLEAAHGRQIERLDDDDRRLERRYRGRAHTRAAAALTQRRSER